MSEGSGTVAVAGRGRVTTALLWVAIAALVLALAGLGWYGSGLVTAQKASTADLARQLRDVSAQEALLAARLDATLTASPAATVTPAVAKQAPETAEATPGERRVFAKIAGSKRAANGWDVTLRIGRYFTGEAAFALATSNGELPVDGVYIQETTATAGVRLLTKTPVALMGWNGASASTNSTVSAEDLVGVTAGGANASKPWSDAWYWFTIRESVVTRVEQQPVP